MLIPLLYSLFSANTTVLHALRRFYCFINNISAVPSVLVCFWSTTTSDPDLASIRIGSTYVLPISSVRDLGVYRLRRQPANTCHRHRQIVLCSTTSDSKRPVLSSTTRPADTNPCFGCQQGRLLLLRAGRCLRSSTGQAGLSSTPPPDSCSQPGAPNASPRFSATFIGCGSRNGFNSVSAFWHSDVSMHQRRHISLRAFVGQPMWKVAAASFLLPP